MLTTILSVVISQFLLTERDHGLVATNVETTAALQSGRTFILNSPNQAASKYMPPTVPVLGKPCYTVVWFQLLVDDKKRSIRPFVVQLNISIHMCKGVTAKKSISNEKFSIANDRLITD